MAKEPAVLLELLVQLGKELIEFFFVVHVASPFPDSACFCSAEQPRAAL